MTTRARRTPCVVTPPCRTPLAPPRARTSTRPVSVPRFPPLSLLGHTVRPCVQSTVCRVLSGVQGYSRMHGAARPTDRISSLEPRKLGSEVFAHTPTHRPPRHPQRPPRTHTIEGDHLRLPSKPHLLIPLWTGTGAPQSQGLDWTVSPPLEVPEFSLLRDTVGERGALSVSRCAV